MNVNPINLNTNFKSYYGYNPTNPGARKQEPYYTCDGGNYWYISEPQPAAPQRQQETSRPSQVDILPMMNPSKEQIAKWAIYG